MKSITGYVKEMVEELGYNPYTSVRVADGSVIDFVDITDLSGLKNVSRSIFYYALKTVALSPITDFFKFVNSYPTNDMYITRLLMEIYLRVGCENLPFTFYLENGASISVDNADDVAQALRDLSGHPKFAWMRYYQQMTDKDSYLPYQTMSEKHILNAFFARAYSELTDISGQFGMPSDVPGLNFTAIIEVSPQVDGIFIFLKLAGVI